MTTSNEYPDYQANKKRLPKSDYEIFKDCFYSEYPFITGGMSEDLFNRIWDESQSIEWNLDMAKDAILSQGLAEHVSL
jgi:hypothetical protein